MKKILTLCMALGLIVAVTSCSKEKKLDSRLAGNTWNIDKIEWVKQELILVTEGTETNAGTFTFTENTGTSTMTIDGETVTGAEFSWDAAGDGGQINLTYSLTIEGTTTTQRAMVIEENKKKSQTWVMTEQRVDASTGETFQLVATLELSK